MYSTAETWMTFAARVAEAAPLTSTIERLFRFVTLLRSASAVPSRARTGCVRASGLTTRPRKLLDRIAVGNRCDARRWLSS